MKSRPHAMRIITGIGLWICIAVAMAQAQLVAPDLSGTWKLDLTRSRLPKGFPITLETIVISYSDETFRFHYTTNTRDYAYTFIVDGRDHPVADYPTGADIANATWKNSGKGIALIIKQKAPNMPALPETAGHYQTTDTWTISQDGRVLSNRSLTNFGTIVYVYDRE